MTTKFWKAAALAALIGVAPVVTATAPAQAGGSFTVQITPKGKGAEKLEKGLSIWSKLRDRREARRNRANVDQKGSNNAAYVGQSGNGNNALVVQRGKGHSASVSQSGDNNALGVFQFGKNTSSNTTQTGGQSGLIFQGGW
jgi:major curlin subunit